jgi:hypothetical protein
MDVFGSVGTAIDLAQKIYVYIKDIKDGGQDREMLASEVKVLQAVLEPLRGRLEREKKLTTPTPWLQAVATLGDPNGPLEQCKACLERIVSKLQIGTKAKGVMRKALWPFSKSDIKEELVTIERLKVVVSLLLENALVYVYCYFIRSAKFILTSISGASSKKCIKTYRIWERLSAL